MGLDSECKLATLDHSLNTEHLVSNIEYQSGMRFPSKFPIRYSILISSPSPAYASVEFISAEHTTASYPDTQTQAPTGTSPTTATGLVR